MMTVGFAEGYNTRPSQRPVRTSPSPDGKRPVTSFSARPRIGVAAGLLVIRFTGIPLIDPIISLMIAGLIVKAAYDGVRLGRYSRLLSGMTNLSDVLF
jgi:hypothetical protein